ncbi:MAG: hypothetical protein CVT77_01465 [Alphaproteobacteria bacterium HGW-Alphaproteobacteria-16]|nr:MAG: hypothetical protein CVT77_01465 [Alphaproteobacteria bacterium HGW-Alphaproteobacteria-16]
MPEHPRFRKILDRVAIRDEIHELLKAPPDCSTEDLASGRAYAGRWFELPQAEHDAMLDLMPPAYMQPGMFVMSEPKAGSIASVLFEIVVRGTRRCFHGYCDLSIHGSTESMRAAIVEQEHAPIGILTRDAKLEAIWERTHPDYRGIAGEANPDAWPREQRGKRTILVHQRGTGTVLKLLDDLTDEEIDAKLPLIVNIINPA